MPAYRNKPEPSDTSVPSYVVLGLMLAVYAGVLTLYNLTRYYELKTSIFDLAIYVQSCWALLQEGRFFFTTPPPFTEQHPFALHFTPYFYLLLPIYAMAPYPETFQVLHVLCFTLAALPIFLSVRALGFSPAHSLLWVLVYLCNPFLLNAAIWDFHEVSLSTLFISWAMWAIITRRRIAMLLFALLLMSCKEHYGLAVAGMGLLWAWRTGEHKLGAAMVVFGLAAVTVIMLYIMPSYNHSGQHLMTVGSSGMNRFGWLRDPLHHLDIIAALIAANLFYGFFLLLPLLGLPLVAPLWLLPAGADLLVNGSSSLGFLRAVTSYHTSPVIPVLVIAAAQGTLHLLTKPQRFTRSDLTMAVTALSLFYGWSLAPLPLPGAANTWEIGSPRLDFAPADRVAITQLRQLLTPERAISAQSNIGSLFARRAQLYYFPVVTDRADTIVLRLEFPLRQRQSIFGNPLGVTAEALHAAYLKVLSQPEWKIAYWNKPWLVLQKNPTTPLTVESDVEQAWQRFIQQYNRAPETGAM